MTERAVLVPSCCSHCGDRCSGVPSPLQGWGVCLKCEGLQKRERDESRGGKETHKVRESHRHFCLTDWREWQGEERDQNEKVTQRCTLSIWWKRYRQEMGAMGGRHGGWEGGRTLSRANTVASLLFSLMLSLKKKSSVLTVSWGKCWDASQAWHFYSLLPVYF